MKSLRFMRVVLFSLLIVLIAGCSSVASGPIPTATSAANSLPAVSGDCPLADLQPWYSYSIVNTKQFMQMLDSAAALKPAQVGPLQARLVGTRSLLGTLVVPPCATAHSYLVFHLMDSALTTLQDYATGKSANITTMITNAHAQYVVIQQNEMQLQGVLNGLYTVQRGK